MKKTFSEWEIEKGLFAHEPSKFGSKTLTEEEFIGLYVKDSGAFRGVNYQDRKKFLEDNDYELTRDNLMNADLPAATREE